MTERQGVRLGASLEDLVVQTLSNDTATNGLETAPPPAGTAVYSLAKFLLARQGNPWPIPWGPGPPR